MTIPLVNVSMNANTRQECKTALESQFRPFRSVLVNVMVRVRVKARVVEVVGVVGLALVMLVEVVEAVRWLW